MTTSPHTFSPHTFDQLYVVSDMHMGGRRNGEENFQIFNQGTRLGHFIRYVGDQVREGRVALVLNGDVFDSLAEDLAGYVALDAASALRMMEHLLHRRVLRASMGGAGVVRGNAPASPRVRRWQSRHRDGAARGRGLDSAAAGRGRRDAWPRILFSTHGAGYGCLVGGKRVFCSHGNELDSWNWVDYSALGQLANAIDAGRRVDVQRWKPNAGTRLVIDVMNEVKRRLPVRRSPRTRGRGGRGGSDDLGSRPVSRIDLTSALARLARRAARREGARATSWAHTQWRCIRRARRRSSLPPTCVRSCSGPTFESFSKTPGRNDRRRASDRRRAHEATPERGCLV